MLEKEIIQLWINGLSKNKLADIYKSRYNKRIKIIRREVPNRHAGRFITKYEALNYIEVTILNYLKRQKHI